MDALGLAPSTSEAKHRIMSHNQVTHLNPNTTFVRDIRRICLKTLSAHRLAYKTAYDSQTSALYFAEKEASAAGTENIVPMRGAEFEANIDLMHGYLSNAPHATSYPSVVIAWSRKIQNIMRELENTALLSLAAYPAHSPSRKEDSRIPVIPNNAYTFKTGEIFDQMYPELANEGFLIGIKQSKGPLSDVSYPLLSHIVRLSSQHHLANEEIDRLVESYSHTLKGLDKQRFAISRLLNNLLVCAKANYVLDIAMLNTEQSCGMGIEEFVESKLLCEQDFASSIKQLSKRVQHCMGSSNEGEMRQRYMEIEKGLEIILKKTQDRLEIVLPIQRKKDAQNHSEPKHGQLKTFDELTDALQAAYDEASQNFHNCSRLITNSYEAKCMHRRQQRYLGRAV